MTAHKNEEWTKRDLGIDIVAELVDGSGFATVQCKFYAADKVISKPDVSTFISDATAKECVADIIPFNPHVEQLF